MALYRQQLLSPMLEVGIVLFGTDVTKNRLAADNVYMYSSEFIDVPDLDALSLQLEAQVGHARSNALDGIMVAIDMPLRCRWGAHIHLFTDEASIICPSEDVDVEEMGKQLFDGGMKLSITLLGNAAPHQNQCAHSLY